MNSPARCFIAVTIDPPVRRALTDLQDRLKTAQADVSWVKPKQLHLTLKFMAKVHGKVLDRVLTALPECLAGRAPFTLELSGIGGFPRLDRPRVIWTGLSRGVDQMQDLAQTIENALGNVGVKKESRPFSPHLTLGRVRSLKNISVLQKAIQENESFPPLSQTVRGVTLFQSTLTSQGAIHEVLLKINF